MNSTTPKYSRIIKTERYDLFFRGQLLVMAGYIIATLETLLAIKFGLTPITIKETAVISSAVLITSAILIMIIYLKKSILIWQEWLVFSIYLIIYLFLYCIWVYKLREFRILGLINSLIAVSIVLSYTSMVQSLMMSLSTLSCHLGTVYYALFFKNQPGNFKSEIFIIICVFPAYLIISIAAYYLNARRKQLEHTKRDLENLNMELNDANGVLRFEHSRSLIEMELAREIQSAFFPSHAPESDDWDVAFINRPSAGVSGDFYDFYYEGRKLKGISLFDVSGHGVAPALITILARPVFYRHFISLPGESLGRVFEEANSELIEQIEDVHIFITGLMTRLCGNRVEYVNAGHPDIIVRQKSTGAVHKIPEKSHALKGHPIGIKDGIQYSSLSFEMQSGDVMLLYSDCFTDCRNCDGDYYGDMRLSRSLAAATGCTSSEILDGIVKDFYEFAGEKNVSDDMTLIVVIKK